MKNVFADTFYYLALLNPDDIAHAQAVALSRSLKAHTYTTAWILTEVADALAAPNQRGCFLALLKSVGNNPAVTVLPPTSELFDAGIDLYSKRPDKSWSLTDCISFAAMQKNQLTEALTGDRHFEQAGFTVLFQQTA